MAPKGLAVLGSELRDSKDVSLSSAESQQIFAGICPSLLTRLPLGQLWLLFPVEPEQRMSWEHTGIKPPCGALELLPGKGGSASCLESGILILTSNSCSSARGLHKGLQ